jgi:hypothetical protein
MNGVFYVARAETVAMQRRGKHFYNNGRAVFSAWSVPRSFLGDNWRYSFSCGIFAEQ